MTRPAAREAGRAWLLLSATAVPWVFGPFFYDAFVLPKLFAAAAAAAVAACLLPREWRPAATPLDAPLAALLLAAAASAALSPDPWPSFLGSHRAYSWSLIGWLPCVLFYRIAASQGPELTAALPAWLAFSAIPVSAYALAQAAGLDPVLGYAALPSGRAISTLGSPIALAGTLAAALPSCLETARGGRRILGWSAGALGVAALAATGTRAGWLALLAGTGVYGSLVSAAPPARRRWTAALAAVAAACALGLAGLSGFRAGSDRERVETWKIALQLFRERPLLGAGPEGFDFALRPRRTPVFAQATVGYSSPEDAHDDWLQVLASLGLVGAAAYAWAHVRLWRLARRAISGALRGPAAALAAGLAALAVQAKLNTAAWAGWFAAATLAAGLAAAAPREEGRGSRGGTLLVSLGLAGLLAVLACADRFERLGVRWRAQGRPRDAARMLEAAAAWRPWETEYRRNLANLLWDAAAEAPPRDRRELLRRAGAVAEQAAARRPADPGAHHLAGLAALRWAKDAAPGARGPALEHARAELLRAAQLDPFFPPVLRDAAEASRLAGDAEAAAALDKRLTRLLQKR